MKELNKNHVHFVLINLNYMIFLFQSEWMAREISNMYVMILFLTIQIKYC